MLARAALEGPWRLTGMHRAEALLQLAKGQLMAGRQVAVDDVVARARDTAADQARTLAVREATCWTEAGQPERAVELYDAALAGELSRRDRGFFSARRSAALARAGQADDAASTAAAALAAGKQAGSARTERVVRGALNDLAPWHARPAVQELAAALTVR